MATSYLYLKEISRRTCRIFRGSLIGELPIDLEFTEALEKGKAEDYVIDSPLFSLIFEGLY